MRTLYAIEYTHHDEESYMGKFLFASHEKAKENILEDGYEEKRNSRNKIFYEKDEYWTYANIREFFLID